MSSPSERGAPSYPAAADVGASTGGSPAAADVGASTAGSNAWLLCNNCMARIRPLPHELSAPPPLHCPNCRSHLVVIVYNDDDDSSDSDADSDADSDDDFDSRYPDFAPLDAILSLEIIPVNNPTDICSICGETFTDTVVTKLPRCTHTYHADCIYKWLMRHNSCPYCRERITTTKEHLPSAIPDDSPFITQYVRRTLRSLTALAQEELKSMKIAETRPASPKDKGGSS